LPDRSDRAAVATLSARLRLQSEAAGRLGSALYEHLLDRATADLEAGGPTWEVLRGHEADPVGSALALRLMGAVNRLVLEGRLPRLAAAYDGEADGEEAWLAFEEALAEHGAAIRAGVKRPIQTNEVGRGAALLPGFFAIAEFAGLPLRLLEVGASAGLNLRWDAYRYEADGFAWGDADSPVHVPFELSPGGVLAPVAAIVAERLGCDANPLDPRTDEGRLTLLSYIWPDQRERVARATAALELAAGLPTTVERAVAPTWIAERLAEPAPGLATVVYHSLVIQYLAEDERAEFETAIEKAGALASAEAPLAWLWMEWAGERADVCLTVWPGGGGRRIARAGYHGTPVELLP
jgi:hypothetical protein